MKLLHHRFIEAAKRHGRKLAIIDRAAGREISYHRALIGSLILAARIRGYQGDYVGILLPTSAGGSLAIIAALMAGKIPVLINYSTGAAENVRYARERCGFEVVLSSRKLLEKIGCPKLPGMLIIEDLLAEVSALEKLRAAFKAAWPAAILRRLVAGGSDGQTAAVLFTSGSEKQPKGVELTHRGLGSNLDGAYERLQCTPNDRIMAVLPIFHVFGLMTNHWLPLCTGMTSICYANPLDFKIVAHIIRDDKATALIGTPYFLAGYLKQADDGDFASLRIVVAGADKLPDWLREAYRARQGIEIMEGYGATETSPVISCNTIDANRPGSVGRPFPGVAVRIIDVDTGDGLATGREGKIMIKGDLVMKGYLGDLEETALRIENGWYETGDMGLVDEDGYLWHKGRLKRFIKIGGEMVSLIQVEAAVEPLLPEGVECCVVEVPDTKKGASIAVALSAPIEIGALQAGLVRVLPKIALPRHYVVIEELPKLASGKIDFRSTAVMVQSQFD